MTSSVLLDTVEKDVRPWLKLAEDLRSLNIEAELGVPQICVMGDQSSGKSSVLEALSGIPFPRGSGLVTRCPIRLVMRKARVGEFWNAVVSTSVSPSERYPCTDVNALSNMISKLTKSLCDSGTTGFSTDSIIIELVSPDACDLTVIDLPGIIRTVTAGQSVYVIEQVNKLIQTYLIDPRTIILAVIPSNQDIATVDILERALVVDPTGMRTVGVLTKVDLIGPGGESEVVEIVKNIRKPLTLGYIMVKNRSQHDLNNNVSYIDSRNNELNYFQSHHYFRSLDSKLYGVNQLSKKLTMLLVSRIQSELLPIKQLIEKQLNDVRGELRSMTTTFISPSSTVSYGSCSSSSSSSSNDIQERQKLLISVMQEYLRILTDGIRGEYRDRMMIRNQELRLYTKVLASFDSFLIKINSTAPAFKTNAFINDLAVKIEQLRGKELPGFLSSQAFSMCMSQYVEMWKIPMYEMMQEVKSKAYDIANKISEHILVQFPVLKEFLSSICSRVLTSTMEVANKRLMDNLQREKDPFTINDFLQQWVNKIRFDRFTEAVDDAFNTTTQTGSNWFALKDDISNKMKEWYGNTHSVSSIASARDTAAILEAYWNLSAKRFVDNCCMVVDREILATLPSALQDEMYRYMKDEKMLEDFFKEDPVFVNRRINTERRRDLLLQVSNTLASIPITSNITSSIPSPSLSSSSSYNSSSISISNSNSSSSSSSSSSSRYRNIHDLNKNQRRESLEITVGASGIGIIVIDSDDGRMAVKGFRSDMNPNPSIVGGVLVGDIVESINGTAPTTPEEAVTLLKSAKGKVILTVIRKISL